MSIERFSKDFLIEKFDLRNISDDIQRHEFVSNHQNTTEIAPYSFAYYSQPIESNPNRDAWDTFVNQLDGIKTIKGILSHERSLIWAVNNDDFGGPGGHVFHADIISASKQVDDPLAYFQLTKVRNSRKELEISIYSEKPENATSDVARYMQKNIRTKGNDVKLILCPGKLGYVGSLDDFIVT